jgi:hypothetical protein
MRVYFVDPFSDIASHCSLIPNTIYPVTHGLLLLSSYPLAAEVTLVLVSAV